MMDDKSLLPNGSFIHKINYKNYLACKKIGPNVNIKNRLKNPQNSTTDAWGVCSHEL